MNNQDNNFNSKSAEDNVNFGYKKVDPDTKRRLVKEVFDSVASKYDIMNTVMSMGMHKWWKYYLLHNSNIQEGDKVLDIASGTGDLAIGLHKQVGETGEVWHTDINFSMLKEGRKRLLDQGVIVPSVVCDAEFLPFPDNYFNTVVVGFGLRNMNNKDQALCEMRRVLKPGGQVLVLEFSKIESETQNSTMHHYMQKAYDLYSLNVLPFFGKIIAGDEESYRYLAESIKLHPSQEELKDLMISCGFYGVEYENLTQGIVAIHRGYK